jgi:hypothetical protein
MTRNCILTSSACILCSLASWPQAERLVDEGRLIADATGNLPVT